MVAATSLRSYQAMARPTPVVATVLEPVDRTRLDAVAEGRFYPVHAESVLQAIRTVREQPVDAVLLAPSRVDRHHLSSVSALVEGFPGVATVAVLSPCAAGGTARLLDLGACGVRRVVDLGDREGWRTLQALLRDPTTPTSARIRAGVIPLLGDASSSSRAFFEATIHLAPSTGTVRVLAEHISVSPSTLMSRFFRAGLPSPKRYLAEIRLLYAASLLAFPGLSITDVAYRLEYSSPQSFGRHLRKLVGVAAAEFRRRHTFNSTLETFVARRIVPYRTTFRTFRPLTYGVADLGQL
jgi:AraC-like DNA-binding protein